MLSNHKKIGFTGILVVCTFFMMWPRVLSAATAKDQYYRAETCYKKLRHNPRKQKYRDKWLTCIEKFNAVYKGDPQGPWAAAGLYMTGQLYQELYKRSFKRSDKEAAADFYERIVTGFPKSRYRHRAESALRDLRYKTTQKLTAVKASSKNDTRKTDDEIEAEIEKFASAPVSTKSNIKASVSDTATVSGLRYWSNPSYTRVVVDADNDIVFSHKLLKKDTSIKKPQRLYIDLNNSRLKKDIKKIVPINDDLLLDARAGQFSSNRVRVVVDIKSFKRYKIFSLKNPFRIVIDIWGEVMAQPPPPVLKANIKGTKLPPGALAKQLALGVSRIVIDPGHGGKDYGAPGYQHGIYEKDINLKLARRLAKKIREELGYEVIMTRNSDRYLTLEERTAIANTKNADLFISIHTNAARDRRAYGIETFYLNLATDNDAILVAARENATSTKNISDLETILSDLMQNAKINESSRLAVYVQKSMCRYLGDHYSRVRGKGVKQAPFYVLLGAQMPAILIETSFISNPRECQRLNSTAYQDRMSEAIVKGIKKYISDMNPTAFMDQNPNPSSGKYGG